MRHRARELLAGQRTAALNALRGHLAEIGVVAPQGAQHAYDLKRLVVDGFDEYGEVVVPDCVRVALRPLVSQIDALDEAIGAIDKEIAMAVKADLPPTSNATGRLIFVSYSRERGDEERARSLLADSTIASCIDTATRHHGGLA